MKAEEYILAEMIISGTETLFVRVTGSKTVTLARIAPDGVSVNVSATVAELEEIAGRLILEGFKVIANNGQCTWDRHVIARKSVHVAARKYLAMAHGIVA